MLTVKAERRPVVTGEQVEMQVVAEKAKPRKIAIANADAGHRQINA